MQRAATPESRLDLPQHSPGSSVTDTRNPRNIYYINLCKVGGNIQKICQICFMKMRQFWIINVSRLRTFTKRFLTWTQEKSKFVLSLSSFLALKNNIDTPGIGYKNVE